MKLQRTGLWLLAALVILVLCTVGFAYAEVTAVLPEEEKCTGFVSDYTDEEAAAAFIARTMTGDGVKRRGAYVGDTLTGQEKKLYDLLKEKIQLVASGELESTDFEFPAGEFFTKTLYTAEELGVTSISDDNIETVISEFGKKFTLDVDFSKIIRALLADCPYDLYWFDKTKGISYANRPGYSLSYTDSEMSITVFTTGIVISMSVSEDYAGTEGSYSVNPVYGQSAAAAAANARQIVSANRNKDDVAKLEAYRDEICSRVSYNDSAAAGGVAYGDPWQMVWVFDNNTKTNVVCEGYSKAFQFLCDESVFVGNVRSIIVSGTMGGGTGEGRHMWNVVRLNNGNNYLVDITNSDSGSVGQDGGLFLAGYSDTGTASDGSTKYFYRAGSQNIWYVYNEDTIALYAAEDLSIANQSYQGGTESGTWDYEYEEGEQMLRITGTGAVKVNGTAPWLGQNYDIKRVMVESGITSIGPGVFAGLDDGVRIDFCQNVIPSIDLGAFGGTEAVCRYTSGNSSWVNDHPEIDGVSWVWMPTFNTMAAGTFGPLWYERDKEVSGEEDDYPGWSVEVNAEGRIYPDMPAETAHEILLYCYDLFLNDIPDPDELETVIGDMEDEYWYFVLTYKCEGTLKLNGEGGISVTQMPREINISSPKLVLEATDTREEGIHKLEVQCGTITYNGNVQQLVLTNSCEEKGTATVNGTIGELDFYNGDGIENRPFFGTLTVTGTVRKGMVYGNSTLTMNVPGVSDNYPLGSDFAGLTFGELAGLENTTVIDTDDDPVIAAELSAADAPTVDQFIPRYVFSGTNNWLDLRPREGSGLGSETIDIDINEYNPDFLDNLTDNIIWGDDTEIHLSTSGDSGPFVLAGKDGTGFGELSASGGCDVKVTCPLGRIQLQPDPEDFGTINMVFENTISGAYLQPNNCKLNITLQNGGSIAEGRWKQLLRDYRNFGAHSAAEGESGSLKLVDNSTLTVMSWTYSELFSSILPSDEAVGQAAGVDHAMATLTETDLSFAEASALQNVVDGEGESLPVRENQIISVFDVSVNEYTVDENGSAEMGNAIHELTEPIPITVSNDSEETDVFVVRLHEDGGNIEAEKLEVTDSNGGKQFESDLFSTYLLVSANAMNTKPEIEGAAFAAAGKDYTFKLLNLATWDGYRLEIYDLTEPVFGGDGMPIPAWTAEGELSGEDSRTFKVPKAKLKADHQYTISAFVYGNYSYESCRHLFRVVSSAKPTVTLEADRDEAGILETVMLTVTPPKGSTAVQLWTDGYIYNKVAVKNGKAELIWSTEYPGEYRMFALATTDKGGVNAPESSWKAYSNVLTITVTQSDMDYYGFTFTPPENLETVPVPRGQMLELTVDAEIPVYRNRLKMIIFDENEDVLKSTGEANAEFPYVLQLPALMEYEDGREYRLMVQACGAGSCWVTENYWFTITDGYAIHFHPNDGTRKEFSQPLPQPEEPEAQVQVQLVSKPFTASGRHIIGWATENTYGNWDPENLVYADGAEATVTSGDLDLYAIWETNNSYLSVDAVDMTYPEAAVNLVEGGTVNVTIWREENNWAPDLYEDVRSTNFLMCGINEVRLHAEPDEDYEFVGWYSGENPVINSQALLPVEPLELLSTETYYFFESSGDEEWKKVCAVFVRSENFGTAAFTVPSALNKIEAYTFEGIGAKSVYVPDTCTEIGAGAFSNCENLLKIRLPKDCIIAPDSFTGSGRVVIYAPAGGSTQEWAEGKGIVFREEK